MTRNLFFGIMIFMTASSSGQKMSDIAVSVLSQERLISKVLSNPELIKNKNLASRFTTDSIDFDVVIYSTVFKNEGETGGVSANEPDYQIFVYTINDSIFFKKIFKIKYRRDKDKLKTENTPVLSYVDTARLSEFVKKHNNKYHSSWTVEDFLSKSSEYGLFGILCGGIVPSLTEEAYSLAHLVKTNDSTALKDLASSFSPAERAFGSAGLYFLLLRGQELSRDLMKLIVTNQDSKIRIWSCHGCVVREQSLAEVLEIMNLISMYDILSMNLLL